MSYRSTGKKCPICGSYLKSLEVTDEEESEKTGEWKTKFTNPICTNHNPYIGFNFDIELQKQIDYFVDRINNNKITVKRKNKFFLENKERLGITRY